MTLIYKAKNYLLFLWKITYLFLIGKTVKNSTYASEYDSISAVYDNLWTKEMAEFTHELLDKLPLCDGMKILDLGCGSGVVSRYLVSKNAHLNITAVDISEQMIDVAKAKFINENIQFFVSDMLDFVLSEKDNKYDTVICAWSLVYTNLNKIFPHIKRILKPDGYFQIIVNRRGTIKLAEKLILRIMQRIPDSIRQINTLGYTIPRNSKQLNKKLKRIGFTNIEANDCEKVMTFNDLQLASEWIVNCGALAGIESIFLNIDFKQEFRTELESYSKNRMPVEFTHKFSTIHSKL